MTVVGHHEPTLGRKELMMVGKCMLQVFDRGLLRCTYQGLARDAPDRRNGPTVNVAKCPTMYHYGMCSWSLVCSS